MNKYRYGAIYNLSNILRPQIEDFKIFRVLFSLKYFKVVRPQIRKRMISIAHT